MYAAVSLSSFIQIAKSDRNKTAVEVAYKVREPEESLKRALREP